MINNNNADNLKELFEETVSYAEKNNIGKIIIFAKGTENVLKLKEEIGDKKIELIVTTFPMNQVLYIENDEGEIEETYPELYSKDERNKLEQKDIRVLPGTLPFEAIIIPGYDNNPYNVISKTLNLFGNGMDIIIQSALMTTDAGITEPGERVVSMNTQMFADLNTANSRFLFHPEKKVLINEIYK
ncbi:hypothetical protein JZO78_04235 [Enterococcus ureilyticus]|uniref:hypothetical protein n=1 Tax=Enterococcus ureilyticus TaxID=1131292 RepID=UPI001A923336|nr:hypothetical protein [Enterococcus ureilyticus]MBO0445543.1 hypothetical protein [Enterococcus ureilyticus]